MCPPGSENNEAINGRLVMVWTQVGIPHRYLYCIVTHELRDGPYVHSGHRQSRSKRVPVLVPGVVWDPRFLQRRIEPVAVRGDRPALRVQKRGGAPIRASAETLQCGDGSHAEQQEETEMMKQRIVEQLGLYM